MSADNYASKLYLRHAPYWKFLRASYLGGRAWYDQNETYDRGYIRPLATSHAEDNVPGTEQAYLIRHMRELDPFYELRFRASVYWNFMRPLVDGMASAVARNARVTVLPTAISYLTESGGQGVDGYGMDLSDFDRMCLVDLIRYGMFHVLTMKPKVPMVEGVEVEGDPYRTAYVPQSIADERDLGMVPYARLISPIDLLSFEYDAETCEYLWVLIRERVPSQPARPFEEKQSDKEDRFRLRYVKPEGWTLHESDGTKVDEGPGVGFVPLHTAIREQHPFEADPVGVSLVEDVAELAKAVYNKYSWLTEEQRNHAFNQWFLKTPTKLTRLDQVAFGSSTYLGGFDDAKILAPDVGPMEHLEESIQHDVQRRARGMLGFGESSEEGVKSGIAIALETEEKAAALGGLAKTFESGKRGWLGQAARVAGADPDEVDVRVDRDFSDLSSMARQTQIIEALKGAGFSGKAKAELQKELLISLLPNITPDDRAALEADIIAGVAKAEAKQEEMQKAIADGAGQPPDDEQVKNPFAVGKPKPPFGGQP